MSIYNEQRARLVGVLRKGDEINRLAGQLPFVKTGAEIKLRLSALINTHNAYKEELRIKMSQLMEEIGCQPDMPHIPYGNHSIEQKMLMKTVFCFSDDYCWPSVGSMSLSAYESDESVDANERAKKCRRYNSMCDKFCDSLVSIHELQSLLNNVVEDKEYSLTGDTITSLGF